jgi:TRAP-type uncharacterized transport system fused permease subunit
METSVQAWKYAKGLYLIPLFMVFNEEIILGGPLPYLLWTGAIAILALAAFAAAIEGYLWAPMPVWQRVLVIPGVIGIFWPVFAWEIAGAALLAVLLLLNWMAGRRPQAATA